MSPQHRSSTSGRAYSLMSPPGEAVSTINRVNVSFSSVRVKIKWVSSERTLSYRSELRPDLNPSFSTCSSPAIAPSLRLWHTHMRKIVNKIAMYYLFMQTFQYCSFFSSINFDFTSQARKFAFCLRQFINSISFIYTRFQGPCRSTLRYTRAAAVRATTTRVSTLPWIVQTRDLLALGVFLQVSYLHSLMSVQLDPRWLMLTAYFLIDAVKRHVRSASLSWAPIQRTHIWLVWDGSNRHLFSLNLLWKFLAKL